MLCKKKSKGINAKTAEARARKVFKEAERERTQASEQAEAAWIASASFKPSKAARRKEDTLARRSEALAKKAEIKKLAAEEQERLEMLYHTGRKQQKCVSKPLIPVSATCEIADRARYNRNKKLPNSRVVGICAEMRPLNTIDDHLDFLKSASVRLSLLHSRRPSIPLHPHLPSRKTLYQASFVCVDA